VTAVSLAIPWREQPSRIAAFEHVTEYFLTLLDAAGIDTELVISDSEGEQFNLAEARNRGVHAAAHDVVLLVDADAIAPRDTVLEALSAAEVDHLTHYCFDGFVYPDAATSRMLLDGMQLEITGGSPHESSVMALTKHAYWTAGGMDERFVGWGGEDNAFRAATDTMNGDSWWHHGTAYALWHDSPGRQASPENLALVARYRAAWKDRTAMHKLIFEDHRVSVTP
jgi:glycosyltransferase involved in cell wall biosynthesis